MGINKNQLLNLVIRPTLAQLELGGESAENLLLGTCAQESAMGAYLAQINGPALGIFQMEPATFNDIYDNYLQYRPELSAKLNKIFDRQLNAVAYNLSYAAALCRIKYLRAPAKLPTASDINGLANYWKQYYNTPQGKGTVEQFVGNYNKFVVRG